MNCDKLRHEATMAYDNCEKEIHEMMREQALVICKNAHPADLDKFLNDFYTDNFIVKFAEEDEIIDRISKVDALFYKKKIEEIH